MDHDTLSVIFLNDKIDELFLFVYTCIYLYTSIYIPVPGLNVKCSLN